MKKGLSHSTPGDRTGRGERVDQRPKGPQLNSVCGQPIRQVVIGQDPGHTESMIPCAAKTKKAQEGEGRLRADPLYP